MSTQNEELNQKGIERKILKQKIKNYFLLDFLIS